MKTGGEASIHGQAAIKIKLVESPKRTELRSIIAETKNQILSKILSSKGFKLWDLQMVSARDYDFFEDIPTEERTFI